MQDCVLLVELHHHLYVVLVFFGANKASVADGQDSSNEVPDILNQLEVLNGLNLISLEVSKQTNVDQCASSGAARSLELKRLYRNPIQITDRIRLCGSTLEKVKKVLHREPSYLIRRGKQNISDMVWPKCPQCGSEFKTKNRSASSSHLRFCKKQ